MDDGRTIRSVSDGLIAQSLRGQACFLEYHLLFRGLFLYGTSRELLSPFMLYLSSKPDVEQTDGTFFFFFIPISCLLFNKTRKNRYFPYIRAYKHTLGLRIWIFLICHQKFICRHTTGRSVYDQSFPTLSNLNNFFWLLIPTKLLPWDVCLVAYFWNFGKTLWTIPKIKILRYTSLEFIPENGICSLLLWYSSVILGK